MLALGFSSCNDAGKVIWSESEIEEVCKQTATSVYFDLVNPTYSNVDEVVDDLDAYQDHMSIDSVFYSLPISTIKRVADVCINKSGQTDKKQIVREYLKNISVYSNMSENLPPSKNDKATATGDGGSGVTKDDSTSVFETSYNYYTDTVGGKPIKVQVKTIKSYVKP
jgi:hypothetical protein